MVASRASTLAVPSRVSQRLPHLTAHDVAEIDAEVREALTEIGEDRLTQMSEEELQGLGLVVAVILGATFLPMAIWAVVTRPSWWRLKKDFYFALSGLGIVFAWCVFIYVIRPGTFWGVASFIVPMYVSFLAAQKFDQL
jgi:hypothetical protein